MFVDLCIYHGNGPPQKYSRFNGPQGFRDNRPKILKSEFNLLFVLCNNGFSGIVVCLWSGILGDGLERNTRGWSGAEYSGMVWNRILGDGLERNTRGWSGAEYLGMVWIGVLGNGGAEY